MSEIYGIDVSEHNGSTIDFSKTEAKFCIIRCGYGSRETQTDKLWSYHLEQCKNNNIPMGVYLYSYATDDSGAESEAELVYKLVSEAKAKGYSFPYGIWYDVEDKSQHLSGSVVSSFINKFIDKLKALGITETIGLYTYKSFMASYIDKSKLNCKIWFASYVYSDGKYHGKDTSVNYDYAIYQYTSTNSDKSWCSKTSLDQNMCYEDFVETEQPQQPSGSTDDDKKKQIEELTEQKTKLETEITSLKTAIDSASNELNKVI